MFDKLKAKILETVEKITNTIKQDREKQIQKIREKRSAYLEEKARQRERKTLEAVREKMVAENKAMAELRRNFTSVKEYMEIAGANLYKLYKLPEDEREIVVRRVQKLQKEDPTFRADLEAWAKQGYAFSSKNQQRVPGASYDKKGRIILGENKFYR